MGRSWDDRLFCWLFRIEVKEYRVRPDEVNDTVEYLTKKANMRQFSTKELMIIAVIAHTVAFAIIVYLEHTKGL